MEDGWAVFFRRVGDEEHAAWKETQSLGSQPGGMELGKHVTTTADLARAWGTLVMKAYGEASSGRVLEIRVPENLAETADFVGPNTDRIGACYFLPIAILSQAIISEVPT